MATTGPRTVSTWPSPSISAAVVTEPLGSTTRRAWRNSQAMARTMASSGTVTTSSTKARTCSNVSSPGRMVSKPSAMLAVRSSVVGRPATSDVDIFAAPAGSTPTTLTPGARCLIAAATPELKPPPPTGTSTVAASGHCSRISRPAVPWPAMIIGWSKGGTMVSCRSAARASARTFRSCDVVPANVTSAP